MPKTGGEQTRQKILDIAESLFSEKGFDAAGMDAIAKAVGINKATIYYHFKDKNEIIISLFNNILEELKQRLDTGRTSNIKDKLRQEIEYMRGKKKILSIAIMESLKQNPVSDVLFHIANASIENEARLRGSKTDKSNKEALNRFFVFEFFSGFMPFIMFVVYEEKWCEYFNCSREEAEEYFLSVFEKTHLSNH